MNVRIMAADESVSNNDGTHWKASKQIKDRSCHLFKLSVSNISGTDLYVWFFNTAAGSAASAAPIATRILPGSVSDTWDFPGGKRFTAGLYIVAATGLPTTPASTPTAAGDDAVILEADIRTG